MSEDAAHRLYNVKKDGRFLVFDENGPTFLTCPLCRWQGPARAARKLAERHKGRRVLVRS